MSYWKLLLRWVISFFNTSKICLHTNVNPLSPYDNFCPDCGKRVVAEWHIIRCNDCHSKRSGYYLFDRFVPYEKFCKRCGESDFRVEVKENIEFFDYYFAAFKFNAPSNPYNNSIKNKSSTIAWVDYSTNPAKTGNNREITYKMLLPATVP